MGYTMPTILTHAVVGLGLGRLFTARKMPLGFWEMAAIMPMLPDADVFAFALGIPYEAPLGHRGFSHSLCFALLAALLFGALTYRTVKVPFLDWLGFLFAVVASHGLLDACTDGGLGVAFFAPFDNTRYFLPWRPIEVSQMGRHFFSARAVSTLLSEFLWVWLPTAAVVLAVEVVRRLRLRASNAIGS